MGEETPQQKQTVERVMHEFKHGELRSGSGRKVRNPRQAIAIGLREAGASNEVSPKQNRDALAKTKANERRGKTAQQQTEGRKPADGTSRAQLYEQAKRRNIPGRSRMNKDELQRALAR